MEGERERGAVVDDDDESAKREEEELLGIKLRKGIAVGKRGGPFTPVPSWKMDPGPGPSLSKPSARKLGASLWEAQELLPPLSNSTKSSRIKSKTMRAHRLHHLSDASEPSSPIRPQSLARLVRHVASSSDQKHKLTERAIGDFKPESPASYNSSVEVSSFNQAITPSCSLDLKGRLRESEHSIKTSAELVKVLNRIWSLEEQLASNVSLVKTVKAELHHAHSRIQELTQEKQAYHYEMDDLMKRISEDRVTRKNKERDRIKAAVQSIKDELEDERKLRRRSESLHRKLGKELSEVNSAFNMALQDLESERKARGLLEDLCDEFAKGFWECEPVIQNMKQEFGKDGNLRFDQSLHHISKVWMDERLQMKIAEAHGEETEKSKILERLAAEIISFFQARRFYNSKNNVACQKNEKEGSLRRRSLESVHLNGAVGAPQDAEDDDSVVSDLHCFELNMDAKDSLSQNHLKHNDDEGVERLKGKSRATFRNEKLKCLEKVEGCDVCSMKQDRSELFNGNKMHLIDSSRGNSSYTGAEECKIHPDNDYADSSNHFSLSNHVTLAGGTNTLGFSDHVTLAGGTNTSGFGDPNNLETLVSHWNNRHASSDLDISKCSSKLRQTVKENSLKEKLLEARLEGRNARLRALKCSSVGGLQ